VCVLALAACGLGPGDELEGGAQLDVTRDFGNRFVGHSARVAKVHESDTVMRFLQKTHEVKTRFGGGFVDSIDGIKGDVGARRDWFYFVNGIEAGIGSADYTLSAGDRIQWDYRSWRVTMRVPAIVGAYPEPLASGSRGRRFPVRVQCERAESAACKEVVDRLEGDGVVATVAALGGQTGEKSIRVLVGKFAALRDLAGPAVLEDGPRASGVFARFEDGGHALRLLDDQARTVRLAPPGTGLLAATEHDSSGLVWVVTGVDDQGVERAAEELSEDQLHGAFAVAVQPDEAVRVPIVKAGR
jgi:uncharacterized protein DUF4430